MPADSRPGLGGAGGGSKKKKRKEKPGLPGATSERSMEVSGDGRLCKLQNESGGEGGGKMQKIDE